MATTTAQIPGLIICDSGYVTKVTAGEELGYDRITNTSPAPTDEIERLAEVKETWYRTTRAWPDLIILDAGYVTRVGEKLIKI